MQKVVHQAHFAGRSVHNIMLSPYVDYTIGSPQYDWLVNDLRAIDRTQTPFVRPEPLRPPVQAKPSFEAHTFTD